MTIGDEFLMRPSIFVSWNEARPKLMPCRVVYIHPERRFYTVEFRSRITGETFRESFLFPERAGSEWENRRRRFSAHKQLAPGRLCPGGIYDAKG